MMTTTCQYKKSEQFVQKYPIITNINGDLNTTKYNSYPNAKALFHNPIMAAFVASFVAGWPLKQQFNLAY